MGNPSHPQILCKEVGLESLFKRHQNGKKHGQIVRCSFGQRAKGYLAFQDQMPERSFSLVVGKRDARIRKAGQIEWDVFPKGCFHAD